MSMALLNQINSSSNNKNNQETKLKQENYVKRLEEFEAIVEKQFSDVKHFVPTNPIIGVTSSVGGNGINEEEEEDDDDDDDDDDATRVLDMAMEDGGILDDTDGWELSKINDMIIIYMIMLVKLHIYNLYIKIIHFFVYSIKMLKFERRI